MRDFPKSESKDRAVLAAFHLRAMRWHRDAGVRLDVDPDEVRALAHADHAALCPGTQVIEWLDTGHLRLNFTGAISEPIIAPIAILEAIAKAVKIEVTVDSFGGDGLLGCWLYDHLLPTKPTVRVGQNCGSAAAVVAASGHRVICSPDTVWLLHGPAASMLGTIETLRIGILQLEDLRTQSAKAIAAKCKRPLPEVLEWHGPDDRFFDAREAVALGLADEISVHGPGAALGPPSQCGAFTPSQNEH